MEKWGLSYNDVKKLKPDIIMLSSSMLGGSGRYRNQKGTGEQLSSFAGFTNITSYLNGAPVGIPNAYTDFIAPFYIIASVIAAVCRRQKTGKGCYIDLSQYETGISFLSHLILENTTNSTSDALYGNHCEYAAPHGAYHCKGEDRWCTIAVFNNKEWRSLLKIIGEPEWSKDPKYKTLLGRKKNEDELNTLIEHWTVNHTAEEVMKMMQQGGIASGIVQSSKDLTEDPQVKYRNHFHALEQPEMGLFNHESSSFKLSKTPAKLRPAPCYGEHTEFICKEILGISDDEFIRLFNNGAFTGPALGKEELIERYFQEATKKRIKEEN
jgi:crotonobetainyl-CoA:carnitine CoA-transferase CaiB-like acyl-CoA transferase